jgi:cyclin H
MFLDMQVRVMLCGCTLALIRLLKTILQGNEDDVSHLASSTYPKASASILLLRLTDAEFLYTPSQIALAAFHMADPSLTERWLSSKLALASESKLIANQAMFKTTLDSLLKDVIDPLVLLVEQAKKAVDVEAVREVDRRLKFCKNPEKNPESSLYKKREREKEEQESRKREKKIAEAKAREVDPFA